MELAKLYLEMGDKAAEALMKEAGQTVFSYERSEWTRGCSSIPVFMASTGHCGHGFLHVSMA
jgi:hypothetical protein